MRVHLALFAVLLSVVVVCAASASEVSVTAKCEPAEGWMKDGWGNVVYTFVNKGETPAKVVAWAAHWEVAGKPFKVDENDEGALDEEVVDLPPGKEIEVRKLGWLPPKAVDAAKPASPVWTGTFTIAVGDETTGLAWKCPVPEAVLPEPLVTMRGDYIGYAMMESRYKDFAAKDRLLTWLNDAYKAMWDLTGHRPYNGDFVMIQESPAHPWWAYAGNPIVMSTACMKGFTDEIDAGIMPFGWIHELGHDFDDGIGEWYIWNGASCEWQANWKLNYAYETMPDQDFKAKWGHNDRAGFNPPGKEALVSGRQMMDSFFLFFGDGYLGDPSRTWDTMESDDLHSFFLRMKDQYGWEPFKQMYRTYVRFEELGLEKPETPEEKINLIAAILSHQTGVDLVPAFRRWRMPVTAEQVAAMGKRYPITNAAELSKPESAEAAQKLIKLTVERVQKDGWMREGWGQIRYTFRNEGGLPSKIVEWKAQWMIGETPYDPEAEDDDGVARDEDVVYLPAGQEVVVTKIGWMDPALLEAAGSVTPVWAGTFKAKTAGYELTVPWRIEVPEAVIKEKLVRVEGKHMAYEITERHHEMLGENNERLIRWLDQAYEAMHELTSYVPYEGKIITIIESPPHPWYAYAGYPIVMDTTYMDDFVKIINRGEMPFGWIHELGHDFDICDYVHPDWYALGLESQANIKVVYAYGAMPDQDWKAVWNSDKGSAYPAPSKGILLDGAVCMDRQFLFEREETMADPTVPWQDAFCEHVFLQRVARVYGWDAVKKYYRTAKILQDKGLPRPETPLERVKLFTAILCETTGADLVPEVRRWRVPVTQEDVASLREQYGLEEAVKSIVLPGEETAKAE